DNTEDNTSDDPFSWADPDVRRVSSLYIQGSSLLGTAKKVCQSGPWSVVVRSCRPDEPMNSQPVAGEAPFFFFYKSIFSKLGIKLPFIAFEHSVFRALNVAPIQLHPNSWAFVRAFVRAFELLCEDWGRAPSLGMFFAVKVGWMSLSGRPRRKLPKPFLKSFKTFKDNFFKVGQGKNDTNILADQTKNPYFSLY
ncbi:hypothetical protein CR513_30601, partial [Mucuna pruriens]